MQISRLASAIGESPTLKLNALAARLREQGEDVIHLGGGEPKTPTPFDAIVAAASKLATANVKYTPTEGILPLRKAICAYTERHYGRTVSPANVLVSTGAKAALYAFLVSVVDPDDEVVFPAPYWVSYPEMVRMVRGVPVIVTPSEGFVPRFEDIVAAVTPRTRAILFNSPNNPSGAVYPASLIEQVVRFCEARGIFLVMDDIYHKLVFDGAKAASCYDFAGPLDDESRLVVINGVSKLYAMTGFRIGWAVAAPSLVKVMTNVQAQSVSCPSGLSQDAALGALTGEQSSVEALRITLENQRDLLVRELATIPGVRVTRPGGTFYCLPDFSRYDGDSGRLSQFLLEKVLVATVPGREFGMDGHLRISYCGSVRDITEGIARIRWALDPSAPRETFVGNRKVVKDW